MDSNNTQDEVEKPIEVIYDTFNLDTHTPTHFRTTKIGEEEKNHRTLIYRSKTEEILMEGIKPFESKRLGKGDVGVSPLQMNSPSCDKPSSAQSQQTFTKNGCNVHGCVKLSFMYVLFSSNIFLSPISESCYHFNLPLTITECYFILMKICFQ